MHLFHSALILPEHLRCILFLTKLLLLAVFVYRVLSIRLLGIHLIFFNSIENVIFSMVVAIKSVLEVALGWFFRFVVPLSEKFLIHSLLLPLLLTVRQPFGANPSFGLVALPHPSLPGTEYPRDSKVLIGSGGAFWILKNLEHLYWSVFNLSIPQA